jgi:hypothetical protein
MTTTRIDTICKPNDHDFVPKHQKSSPSGTDTEVTAVYCRKCGTVCFLTTQETPLISKPS